MNQEETYRSLMDYFNGKRMKILESGEPSFIRVDIGSGGFLEELSGEVEASVSKRDGGSYVYLNFNFYKTYWTIFLSIPLFFVMIIIFATVWAWSTEEIIGVGGFLTFIAFTILIALVSRSISETKKRLLEELGNLLRSISESKMHQARTQETIAAEQDK